MSQPEGLHIEGYEDVAAIGRGGFATVYRARQAAFNRIVALKVLSGAHFDEPMRRRFDRERIAMGSVSSHPNIVTVFESGFTGEGVPYLAMEFLPFGSLADRLQKRGPLNWRDTLAIGVKLAGALETAHRAGVLHRDVKPENVLLSSFREPQLTDFGIARLATATETSSGQHSLTVAHAPPEIVSGRRPSEQSDVYSLASTLFALMWGRSPFEGDEDESLVAVLARIASAPVPDIRRISVPDPLCAALERALAKDPADRHDSAYGFGEDLRRVQSVLGLDPTPLPLVEESSAAVWAVSDRPGPPRASDTNPAPAPAASAGPAPAPAPAAFEFNPAYRGDGTVRDGPAAPAGHTAPAPSPSPPPPSTGRPVRRPTARRWPAVLLLVVAPLVGAGVIAAIQVGDRSTTTTTTAVPSPTSVVGSSVPPDQAPATPPVPAGEVAAGRYVTSVLRPTVVLGFQPGWKNNYENGDLLELVRVDQPQQRMQFVRVQRVFRQQAIATIAGSKSLVEPVPSNLPDWLRGLPTATAGPLRNVARAGRAGSQVDVVFTGYAYEGCGTRRCVLMFQLDAGTDRPDPYPFVKTQGEKARFYVFDVGPDKLVVVISAPADQFDQFVSDSERLLSIERMGG